MSSSFAAFREVARELGTARALALAPRWALRTRYAIACFAHGPSSRYPPLPPIDGLRLTRCTELDLSRVGALNPTTSEGELRRRLEENQEGTLVFENGELIHVRWEAFSDHHLPFLDLDFRLYPGDHHRLGSYTRPDRRGRGLHTALVALSLHTARERGCLRSFGLVAAWNTPARRAVERTDSSVSEKPIGTIGAWRVGPIRRYVATGAARLEPGRRFSVDRS